jgi:hypothetical protein
MCHLLTKKLVYNLCLKSQIRYPAGLAPWTSDQYYTLDRIPTALLRQIYGLRRTWIRRAIDA